MPDTSRARGPGARLWRGPVSDPSWSRPALLALAGATAVLYMWHLGDSRWANAYYTAAVQAGTRSWKAFFFGSVDSASFITVDKAPLALWPMVLSARLFGLNAWSVLVPQAVEGVVAVVLLHATSRRWFGPAPALLGAAVMACTPAATLMFRYNNPDALLVCLLVAAAYWMTRAIEDGRTGWLVLAGCAVGMAFLAKELQAFLVMPGFAAAYLVAGPPRLGRRVVQLAWCGLAMLAAGGWWVAIVSAWPAGSRPYIGGSQDNTFLNVLFGYNGLGRLTGDETGSVGGFAQPGAGMWGPTGWTRLFNDAFGGQASWLLPAALALLLLAAAVTLRAPRVDRTRAALIMWGGWLLVTGVAFSMGKGIIHEYYTVALAPAIGAAVAIGCAALGRMSRPVLARASAASAVGLTVWWARVLLGRSPRWNPWLRQVLTAGGCIAVVLLLLSSRRRVTVIAVAVAAVVALAAPVASSVATALASHEGPLPTAGPATLGGRGAGPFGGGPRGAQGPAPGAPGFFGGALAGGFPGPAQVGAPGAFPPSFGASRVGGGGGMFSSSAPPDGVVKLLKAAAGDYRWVAAGIGATTTAGYQLATGEPVMAIGGFNGTDPAPTLEEFQAYVRGGEVRYFIAGDGPSGRGGGGPSASQAQGSGSRVSRWVSKHFEPVTVGGVTLYDLASPVG